MLWCHSGSANNYVRFRNIQMQKLKVFLGFWACTSICQSSVSLAPNSNTTTTCPPPETTFHSCLFHCKQIEVRSQAHQQLGPVSVCRSKNSVQVLVNGGLWVHQGTVHRYRPAGLFEGTRKVRETLILFERFQNVNFGVFPTPPWVIAAAK